MSEQNIKTAEHCESMQDVRSAIDSIDQQLLNLLAERITYIQRAAEIKTNIETIRDDERIMAIIEKRRSQAQEIGYSDEFIESFFRHLIEYSIDHEMQVFKKINQI